MKNNTILTTVAVIGGCIIVAVMGVSMTHVGTPDIHQPVIKDDSVVRKPEFEQFQQRVIDGLDDIKDAQKIMQEDIKHIRNGH